MQILKFGCLQRPNSKYKKNLEKTNKNRLPSGDKIWWWFMRVETYIIKMQFKNRFAPFRSESVDQQRSSIAI